MALDFTAASLEVQTRLGISQADADRWVTSAVEYIANDTGLNVETDLAYNSTTGLFDAAPLFPDNAPSNTQQGVVLQAMRIAQDTPLPSGQVSSFDPTFGGVPGVPRVLDAHIEFYTKHLRGLSGEFGIA